MFPDSEIDTNGIGSTKVTIDKFGNTVFPTVPNQASMAPATTTNVPAVKLKVVYKTLEVNSVQGSVSASLLLDNKIKLIQGIALTTNKDDLISNVRTQLSINSTEVLPEEFEASLLLTTATVRPDERFLQLNTEPGNGIIKVVVKDNSSPFTTQKLVFTVKCLSE